MFDYSLPMKCTYQRRKMQRKRSSGERHDVI